MSRSVKTLLLILLIQCCIIAVVYWPMQAQHRTMDMRELVVLDQDSLEEIHISDVPNTKAVVRKVGSLWILPELDDLPADPLLVEKLIAGLVDADASWPVAKSAAARQRFQVADYHHQRSITLFSDHAKETKIYLGTSPGYRKVHARNANSDAIYTIKFNVFDAPGKSRAWIDRKLLQVRTPVRITADEHSIHRQEGGWQSADGQQPDERELEALLAALRSLQVDGVASESQQDKLALIEADLLLEIESLSGNISLGFYSMKSQHFISSSEYPFLFKLSAYDFDRLMGIDFALLTPQPAPPQSPPDPNQ